MLRRASTLLLLGLSLAVTGCPKAPPKVEMPPGSEVKIPTGCEADLDGLWVHSRDASFRYTATDDGSTVTLVAERTPAESTGPADAEVTDADAQDAAAERVAPTITLQRTKSGFRGHTVAEQFLPDGQRCEVPYPTEIIGCTSSQLTLSTATYVAVDVECRVAPTAEESPREQHRLERAKPESGDDAADTSTPSS